VIIDGSTAPSFAGSPVVTVNFQGFKGLNFAAGSDGSILKSLSLIKAGNAGVTLNASLITVQGNFIGLQTDGKTVAGNRGDGVQINASSHGDLIGQSDPVSSVDYSNMVIGGQDNQIGSPTGGNIITGNGQDGLYVSGVVTGTEAEGNQINSNTSNGVTLAQARRVVIGGSAAGTGNQIVSNQGYGVYAFGISTGSVVQQNVIAENTAGDVNLTKASGITFIR
jgi:hypothetical protein